MAGFFVLDLETLGTESTSVILSVALLYVDLTKPKHTWDELYENTLFLKLNVRDQVEHYGRTVDKDTIAWWNKQCDLAKNMSFVPKKSDILAKDIPAILRNYVREQTDNNYQDSLCFIRGSLDQMCLDSLFKVLDEQVLFSYSIYRDARTYIECVSTNPVRGYCDIDRTLYPEFDRNVVVKHNPIDDTVLDGLMILYPI